MRSSILRAMSRVRRFARGHVVLCVAAAAAALTMLAVPPDAAYAGYFDVSTLICLFCILAVAGALRNAGAFDRAACAVIRRFSTPRSAVVALVLTTALLSLFATNDMALIMMLPLAAATLVRAGWVPLIPVTFVLQGLAANLGGMIMPFGNPQNLYLYSYYALSLGDFLRVMLVPFAVSMVLVTACACVLPARVGSLGASAGRDARPPELDVRRACACVALLAIAVGSVLRVVPPSLALACVAGVLAVIDRRALRDVDYALLFTFACFFVFSGNAARIPAVRDVLEGLMASHALLVSAGLSQVISNVPAAVLLSHFTGAWQPLLVGVNIGGAGTLVGSLASLITLQHFLAVREMPFVRAAADLPVSRFLALFFALNLAFLAVLLGVCAAVPALA